MDFQFNDWWAALTNFQKVFWVLSIPFTLFFIIQLVLTFFGGDIPDDVTADAEVETDVGFSFQFFTLKNFVAFFTVFSWVGIASTESGYSNGTTIIISIISGLVMMGIMSAIFYYMGKLTTSGTLNIRNAIGKIGKVYLPIQGNNGNVGQVQVTVQGSLRTLDAISTEEEDLPTGAVVMVVDIKENILIVSKKIATS